MKLSGACLVVIGLSLGIAGTSCTLAEQVSAPEKAGVLRVALVAQASGIMYRLRNALFTITGPSSTQLDSETNPDAAALTTTLNVGSYTVQLENGWALERLDAAGPVGVQASLVSPNPVSVSVVQGGSADANFQFLTNGVLINLGTGKLNVTFGVSHACDPFDQSTCPGEACYPSAQGGVCAIVASPAGNLGEPCSYLNSCLAGLACANPTNVAGQGTCATICNPTAMGSCGTGICSPLYTAQLGACVP